jgi:hypothetical protein
LSPIAAHPEIKITIQSKIKKCGYMKKILLFIFIFLFTVFAQQKRVVTSIDTTKNKNGAELN